MYHGLSLDTLDIAFRYRSLIALILGNKASVLLIASMFILPLITGGSLVAAFLRGFVDALVTIFDLL